MASVTKTINPLHFEDLEPHRFEDLVRQLIYDFRNWSALEATGRAGSDEGFDVRGREVVLNSEVPDSKEDEDLEPLTSERIWLIQCKREKSITPKKMEKYLVSFGKDEIKNLHGLIFAAACDFSKKTRDIFRAKCREFEIEEYYLWGKAELEDMLYQKKNDNLLFAYFGISLGIRHRSLKTQLRSRLAIKRKTIKCLGGIMDRGVTTVLIRDAGETRYPYEGEIKDFDKKPRWMHLRFEGHTYDGVEFCTGRFMAYLGDDKVQWDYVNKLNLAKQDNPYSFPSAISTEESNIRYFWHGIPKQNRAWLEVFRVVLYDRVLAIDESGDVNYTVPHLYVDFEDKHGPFDPYERASIFVDKIGAEKISNPSFDDRIKYFPDEFPEPPEDDKAEGLIDPVDS